MVGHHHDLRARSATPEGTVYQVTAQVSLGDLEPEDIEVQILYGAVDLDDELRDPVCVPMIFAGDGDQPGLAPLHLRARLRSGRQLRLHRAHRAVPPRPGAATPSSARWRGPRLLRHPQLTNDCVGSPDQPRETYARTVEGWSAWG